MTSLGLGGTVFTQEQIQQRVAEVGAQINRDYQQQELVAIGVLKGSVYFMADLTRNLSMPLVIDFLSIGISHDDKMEGIHVTKDVEVKLAGRQVLLVEDIVGTGFTLGYICQYLERYQPASIKICTLLDNPAERLLTINIDYRCFMMPDVFVVGYGLDYRQRYRNLPYIAEYTRG
jgi:hypoxanthine phosphoribosyltransferase